MVLSASLSQVEFFDLTGKSEFLKHFSGKTDGGAEGVRTPDLLNAIQALYQLSYDPNQSPANLSSPTILSKPF